MVGGVQLGPLGTAATIKPILRAPVDYDTSFYITTIINSYSKLQFPVLLTPFYIYPRQFRRQLLMTYSIK
jgi:hypothetical protein